MQSAADATADGVILFTFPAVQRWMMLGCVASWQKMAARSISRRAASGENIVGRVRSPAKGMGLLAAVGVVVVAYCVDLTERGWGAGSLLSWCGLAAMGDGGSADLGGTSIIEVLEAACGGEGGSGAPGGEADQGVGGGGTATEETGKEAGESEGSYFEEATGGASGSTGGHGSVSEARIRSKCRTSGDCD